MHACSFFVKPLHSCANEFGRKLGKEIAVEIFKPGNSHDKIILLCKNLATLR